MADSKEKSILTRVPPQNNEAEMAVLCCCLDAPDKLPMIMTYLLADDFYVPAHKKIYEMIYNLYSQTKTVDLITVGDALKKQGDLEKVGGMEYLSSIVDSHALVSNLTDYVRIVKQKSLSRRLLRTMEDLMSQTYAGEADPASLLEVAISRLAELRDSNAGDESLVSLKDVLTETIHRFFDDDKEKAVMSHFAQLDYVTNGFRPGTLAVVAARPSMGKSAFVINIAVNVALKDNLPVAFFSLEMNAQEIANRILASRCDLSISTLQSNHKLERETIDRINSSLPILQNVPLYIDEHSGLNTAQILTRCRELQNKLGRNLGLICIDYLQLMSAVTQRNNSSRQQEVSEISRGLKLMAKELKVPVIALAQLSRKSEDRDDRRPILSDLRDSGAIEQDADMVMFIHRPDYYNRKEDLDEEVEEEPNNNAGKKPHFKKRKDDEEIQKAEIIVAKNRQGPTKTVYLQWNGSRTVFFEKDKPEAEDSPVHASDRDIPSENVGRSVPVPEELFPEPSLSIPVPQNAGAGNAVAGQGAGAGNGSSAGASSAPSASPKAPSDDPFGGLASMDLDGSAQPGNGAAPAPAIELPPVEVPAEAIPPMDIDMAPEFSAADIPAEPDAEPVVIPEAPIDDSFQLNTDAIPMDTLEGFEEMDGVPWETDNAGEDEDEEPEEPEDNGWYNDPGDSSDE